MEDWSHNGMSESFWEEDIASDGFSLNAGLIKLQKGKDNKGEMRDWTIEKESRLRVTVRPIAKEYVHNGCCFEYPKPQFDYLFVSIDGLIANIELSDMCTAEEKLRFEEIIQKHNC